jgi:hypothetical protein
MMNFGALGFLPDIPSIQEQINQRFDQVFHYDLTGQRHAFVCTFCDKYIISLHDVNYVAIDNVQANRNLFLCSGLVT